MNCLKNPKKFLFIKFNGPHHFELKKVSRFGSYSWAQYETGYECKHCGVSPGFLVRRESELVKEGLNLEKLRGLDRWSKSVEELR